MEEELEVLILLAVIILEAPVEKELLLLKNLVLVTRLRVCGHKKLSTLIKLQEPGRKIFFASHVYPTF